MPAHDEDVPRLAEIARTLTDFRNEFRNAMSEVVRKDVYNAHMANMQMQIDNITKETLRLDKEMGDDRADRTTERREVRRALFTAVLSGVVAVGILLLEVLIK